MTAPVAEPIHPKDGRLLRLWKRLRAVPAVRWLWGAAGVLLLSSTLLVIYALDGSPWAVAGACAVWAGLLVVLAGALE